MTVYGKMYYEAEDHGRSQWGIRTDTASFASLTH